MIGENEKKVAKASRKSPRKAKPTEKYQEYQKYLNRLRLCDLKIKKKNIQRSDKTR